MVVVTLIVLGGVLVFPYGGAVLKLFVMAVGTGLLAFAAVRALRRRR